MQQPDDYQTIDGRCRAADAALLAATRSARARARERWSAPHKIDSVAESDPAVVAAKAAHRSAILELQKFCRENGLDLFGAPRREGSGAYGQFQIIQIPRRERGL